MHPILHEVPCCHLTLYIFGIPCCICQDHATNRNISISRQNHLPRQKISSTLQHLHYAASLTVLLHYCFQNGLYICTVFVPLAISFLFLTIFAIFYLFIRPLPFKKPLCRQRRYNITSSLGLQLLTGYSCHIAAISGTLHIIL